MWFCFYARYTTPPLRACCMFFAGSQCGMDFYLLMIFYRGVGGNVSESDTISRATAPVMVLCQDWQHSAGGRIPSRATARNGSYDNMMCRAGWMKALHPAMFPRWKFWPCVRTGNIQQGGQIPSILLFSYPFLCYNLFGF